MEAAGIGIRTLTAPGMAANFAPSLGMVCCSLVHGGEELLEQRGGLDAYAERGSTMGIPLLHPWANRLAAPVAASPLLHTDPDGVPMHGVLPSALPFTVEHETASSLDAVFATDDHPGVLEVFPYPHRLRVQASLTDDELEIRTTLLALGRRPVPITFGYHPYVRLPGDSRSTTEIEVPAPTRLVLDERQIPTGERVRASIAPGPLAERTFDDGFADVADGMSFVARGAGRTVTVTFLEGYPFAQVYAPEDSEFICYEPMTAPTNALASGDSLTRVRPGDAYTAAFRIGVT
jgi:galactose mutarotase-like enzyme